MLLFLSALAMGQQADVATNTQLLHPTIDGTHTLWTDDSGTRFTGWTAARALFSYTHRPFIYQPSGGSEEVALVSDALQANLMAGYAVDRVRFGVDVPVYLWTAGELEDGGPGVGDVAVEARGLILDREQTQGLGVAVTGRAMLPTSTSQLALGEEKVRGEIGGIVDYSAGPLRTAANVGLRINPTVTLDNVALGDQVFARIGAGYEVEDGSGFSVDLVGHLNLSDKANNVAGVPIEGMLGMWTQVAPGLMVRGGVGAGLTAGVGSPEYRLVLGVGYAPGRNAAADIDADGIVDAQDACPEVAEDLDRFEDQDGCPELDNDADGVTDTQDACPNEPEDADEWEDDDGCPEVAAPVSVDIRTQDGASIGNASTRVEGTDVDRVDDGQFTAGLAPGVYTLTAEAPGFVPSERRFRVSGEAPMHVEVALEPTEPTGTLKLVVISTTGEPVTDAYWQMEGEEPQPLPEGPVALGLGQYVVTVGAPGFAPMTSATEVAADATTRLAFMLTPARVSVTSERIDLGEKVFFDTGRASIQTASFDLLDEVAAVMSDHPEILRVRIEGHTDSRGSETANLRLSQQRAESVKAYLIQRGVEEARLQAVGFGESTPLDPTNTEAAWERNRRVEIFILARE